MQVFQIRFKIGSNDDDKDDRRLQIEKILASFLLSNDYVTMFS